MHDLVQGRVEALYAYISNAPFVLNQLGMDYSILKPLSYGMDFYGDVLVTHQALEARKPGMVAAFRAASMRGWHYALQQPNEIVDLILKQYNSQGKSREHLAYEARELHRLINPEVIEIGHSNPGRWQQIAQTFERFGLVRLDKPLDEFFYQPLRPVDLTWLYWTLAGIIAVLLLVGGIAAYVHRVNRRLALALEQISRSEKRHRIIFQTSASAGVVWREGFIVTDWNRQAEAVFGWRRDEVLGRCFTDFLLPPVEVQRLQPDLADTTPAGLLSHSINQNLTRDGRLITCEWFNAWLPERPGEPPEVVSLATDISERLRLEEEIRQLAFFDPLTHLPNRRLLRDRLGRELARARRDGSLGALMFLDLDNFKPLNDEHGHEVGDLLLQEVAQRLSACVRDSDSLARFGGDEFVCLLGDLDSNPTWARVISESIGGKILRRLAEPYRLTSSAGDEVIHRCSASLGLALFTGADAVEDILRRADQAMYSAKQAGRNRMAVDV
ncbi:MAG: diguanylate cyclase [Gammaproteobacteria bacterium]|nr:diguanylate cyclase [Gammaproteobacteria bacterium]